jgi:hypothetical protein
MRVFCSAFLVLLVAIAPSFADDDAAPRRTINVVNHGAKCNGKHDDTEAFRKAITAASKGGVVSVPSGRCVLTDTLVIDGSSQVSIVGAGRGSQIFQSANKTLLQLQNVQAVMIKNLYLGSAATAAGTSLLDLVNSHRNRIDNVTMMGGYYGVHLYGSLLNTIVDLRSGVNIGGFFAATSTNQYWVYAERDHVNHISSNANTFLAPVLEGGSYGIYIQDAPDPGCMGCVRNGEGSLQIAGGTIEGVAQTALVLQDTFLPSSVTGVHFEGNGTDVLIDQSANIRLTAVLSVGGPGGSGAHGIRVQGATTRNIQITDSIIQQIITDTTVKRFQLQNITTDLQCTGIGGVTPAGPWDASVIYTNVGLNCT